MVGKIIVTSCEVYVGLSGIGIALKVQCEIAVTIVRVYRNNLKKI